MKKSSLTLLSLLAFSAPVFGQLASDLVLSSSGESGTHQFTQGAGMIGLNLCTYELCTVDERGYLKVDFVAAGSSASIIAQASDPDSKKYLVFYPPGQEGNPDKRRILRNRYMISFAEGADLNAIKQRCGMESIRLFREGSKIAICEEVSAGRVLSQLTNVLTDPQIVSAQPIFAKKRIKRLTPGDPFFASDTTTLADGNYQWYLNNEGVNGGVPDVDINLEDALDFATGAGIRVAVVDDGVAIDHIDLFTNAAAGPHLSLFADNPLFAGDPSTFDLDSNHGTAVAGLIAASSDAIGMSGVAPDAALSGVRLLPSVDEFDILIDDEMEAEALLFSLDQVDIYSNSWGPIDSTLDLAAPGPLVLDAFQAGVETGRVVNGEPRGVIYVWAGGNGGEIFDRSDYDGYANSKYTIAVGAIDDSGRKSSFSEEGSNLVVAAPSSGGSQDIVTTSFGLGVDDDDNIIRTSEYVSDFGGTSASAPIVAGVVALMLEENPDLNWREVQDILIRSAVQVNASDGDWIENAAGITFNHKFGAGLVDATAAVRRSLIGDPNAEPPVPAWEPLGPVVSQELLQVFSSNPDDQFSQSGVVPDNAGASLVLTYDMSVDSAGNAADNLKVEHVELRARIITQSRTDLEVVLISPNGTQSILHAVDQDNDEQSIDDWTFMTVRNWGEGSAGKWFIRVTDRITGNNPAVFQNATLRINGVVDPTAPVSEIPILTSATTVTLDQGEDFTYIVESEGAESVSVAGLPEGVTFDAETNTISGVFSDAGLFSIPILLTDEFGAEGNFTVSVVVRPTAVALGEAVGLDGIPAVFGGDGSWDFEFVDTNSEGPGEDGISARSAVGLEDGQTSIFGFDNLGEGVILFDWKASSEEGFDRLWFNRGGDVPHTWDAFISGSRDWARIAVQLPDSSNDVRWIYTKDESFAEGEDRGLVDNIELVTMDKFMADVASAVNLEGFELELDSKAMFFPIDFATGSPDEDGNRRLLQSSAIGNGQAVSLAGWVDGPGTLSFSALNFAEASDVLELIVDGVLIESYAGDAVSAGVTRHAPTFSVGDGRHRIQIRFRKDFRGSVGREILDQTFDWVFIDDLKFTPTSSFASFLAGVDQNFDDGDEYSLFEEYAFSGDHTIADVPRYLPVIVESGGNSFIEYGFNTSLTNLDYTAEQSSNLVDWDDAELAILNRMEGDVAVYRIPISSQAGRSRLFFRVKAEEK